MRKLYLFLLIFGVSSTIALASLETIEQNMSECLKGLSDNIAMSNCTIKASSDVEKEIDSILPKMQSINNNQSMWNLYKNSTETYVNNLLEASLGTMYYLLSKNNSYNMNRNRLFVINNLEKNVPYTQERYLTDSLSNCLSKSSTNFDKEKCYIKETQLCSNQINNQLLELQTLLPSKEYNAVKNNHLLWLNYKNNTEQMLNNKTSNLVKAQIITTLHQEWAGILFTLTLPYKN